MERLSDVLSLALGFVLAGVVMAISERTQTSMQLDVVNNVVAPLLVAAITGPAAWILGRWKAQAHTRSAPIRYVERLDELITRGEREGPGNAVVNARAIVAARDGLRSSLVSLSGQLNSEIDRLAGEIVRGGVPYVVTRVENHIRSDEPNPEEVFNTIRVLARTWPAKREQIQVEVRKLLAELDLL
jgi:hypothetical protein